MKKLILAIGIVILFTTCKKDKKTDVCKTNNPLKELSWLAAIKDSLATNCGTCGNSIYKAKYKNQVVFFTSVGSLASSIICDYVFSAMLFNCEGVVIKKFDQSNVNEFDTQVIEKSILYSCP